MRNSRGPQKPAAAFEHSLKLVAEDTPVPLGTELNYVAQRLDMGVTLKEAVRDLPMRTGINTFNLLNTTLVCNSRLAATW